MVDVERLLKGQASLSPAPMTGIAEAAKDAPRRPNDNKISNVWRREDLQSQKDGSDHAQEIPKNPASEDTRKLGVAKKEIAKLVACCDESEAKQKDLEAKLASASKETHMKRNIVIAMLAIATGYLGYEKYTSYQFEDFTVRQMSDPALLAGKTTLEVSPEMENAGVKKFVSVAQHLPYADANTIYQLLNENMRWVKQCYDVDGDPVVELHKCSTYFEEMSGSSRAVILVHVFPSSIGVYVCAKDKKDGRENPILLRDDLTDPENYTVAHKNLMRMVPLVMHFPPATYEELKKLSGMTPIAMDDASRVVMLIGSYGTSEQLIRLTDPDYAMFRATGWDNTCHYSDNFAKKQENVSVK